MSRVNGKFPKYEKIDVNSDVWPKSYWNESMACLVCEINWPCTLQFFICPECHNENTETDHKPTYRWPEAVTKLLNARFEDLYEIWDTEIEESVKEVYHASC